MEDESKVWEGSVLEDYVWKLEMLVVNIRLELLIRPPWKSRKVWSPAKTWRNHYKSVIDEVLCVLGNLSARASDILKIGVYGEFRKLVLQMRMLDELLLSDIFFQ